MLNFIELVAAIPVIFKLGFPIKKENLVELSPEELSSLGRQGHDLSNKWYRVTRGIFEDCNNPPAEIPIVNASEANSLLRASEMIISMSEKSEREFQSFQERLDYCKGVLPPIFDFSDGDQEETECTQDASKPKLRVIKGGQDS